MTMPFESILQHLAAWIWNTSLCATVLIGLVLLVQVFFRKWLPPRWRYGLWLLVVLRLMMPAVPSSGISVFNLGAGLENLWSTLQRPKATSARLVTASQAHSEEPPRASSDQETRLSASQRIPADVTPSHFNMISALINAATYLWLIGVTGYFLGVVVQQRRLAAWVRRQRPVATPRLVTLVETDKAILGLNQDIRIIQTSCLRTPAIFGFRKPCLLLPRVMIESLNDQELRLVILHELVHVKRRDILLNWTIVILQSLHWFNPAVWLALKRLRAEREMVCDAVVLSHLGAEERRDYGGTLIKLVDYISKPPLVPSLIPIINRKHEIERRITMIAQFKPTPRLITLASAALLLALAGFTFTGAAEKEVPQKNPEKPKSESDLAKQRETHERRFRVLEREMDKLNREVRDAQALVDELREKLVITSDAREDSGSSVNAEALRQLERLRIEAQAEYEQMNTLFTHLAKLSRPELRKAIMTASPDPQLSELFNAMAVTEQKLADLSDNHAADHPDVKRMKRVLQTINTQVNDRLDGILEGLKARAASHKAKLERLQAEVEKAKVHDIATAIQRRPYFQAKRDLESLQEVLAALKRRVIQEKIDVEIPKGP